MFWRVRNRPCRQGRRGDQGSHLEPAAAPDRGGSTAFSGSLSPRPPRQVSWVFHGDNSVLKRLVAFQNNQRLLGYRPTSALHTCSPRCNRPRCETMKETSVNRIPWNLGFLVRKKAGKYQAAWEEVDGVLPWENRYPIPQRVRAQISRTTAAFSATWSPNC